MPAICLYFKVHQPYRLKPLSVFDIGTAPDYFSDPAAGERRDNAAIIKKVARKCYGPTNALLLKLLQKYPALRVSFSLSGIFLEQIAEHAPEVLTSFQRLAATGRVELLGETYYHSLAFLKSEVEFVQQIRLQEQVLKELFGVRPRFFSNTEAAYNNQIGRLIYNLGYQGILTEGADKILGWRSPNFLYAAKDLPGLTLLTKNYRLSDDIAFRFSERSWREWPLTAPKFARWLSAFNGNGEVVNLFMDYETFGEHQWAETGIFDFLEHLPGEILKDPDNFFVTPSETAARFKPVAELDVPDFITWADTERDLSAWLENDMQRAALENVFSLEHRVRRRAARTLLDTWRRLQTSDHFYYMCTKWLADGNIHKYFNAYDSPYEAYITYMNTLNDFKLRLAKKPS